MTAIEFENVSKQYRLGLVSTGTLAHDLNRFWQTRILGREDPYLKIGETNDRSKKGESDYVWALRDINFKVEQGDVVGNIGRNGAGKSTLLKLLSRVTAPTTGVIRARGRIASLLEVGTGFHPEMTGRENIFMNGSIMGMSHDEITRKLDEIVDFSGCERYLDTPVKRYSSGMTVRLGFAIAAHLEPEILVVDEVLAVGDAEFQKKAVGKMQDVSRGGGRTVLFVSHNMRAVRNLCKSGLVLKNGSVSCIGKIDDCIAHYLADSVNTSQYGSLSEIPRPGDCSGTIRFTNVQFCDVDGVVAQPRCGKPLRIKLEFDVFENEKSCTISFGIRDMTGNVLIVLSTNHVCSFLNLAKGHHKAEFLVPKLPLSEGEYNCYLYAGGFQKRADYLENATKMSVQEDDFFGNGKMVGGHILGRIVLCDHQWHLDE